MSIILNEDTKAIYLKIKFNYITFLLITKFKKVLNLYKHVKQKKKKYR